MLKRALFFSTPFCLSLKDNQMVINTKQMPDMKKRVPIEDIGYVRHCPSKESMDVHIARVQKSMPQAGYVSILSVTDKQFGEILNFWGKVERAKLTTPQQLEIF